MINTQTARSSHPISGKGRSSIGLRRYLLPKNIDDMPESFKKMHNIIDISVLVALNDQAIIEHQKSVQHKIIKFFSNFGIVIRPDNPYLLAWQVLIALIIIYYIVEIGLIIGFGQEFWQDEYSTLLGLQIFFVAVLFLDILISPFKAFYSQGLLINEVSLIFKRYVKLQIYLDVLGLISVLLPLILGSVESNWVKVLWLLKLYTLDSINQQFERMTQIYIFSNTMYLVLKLVVLSLFFSHFVGIFFYLVSLQLYKLNYYGPNTPNIVWIYNSQAFHFMVRLPWSEMYSYIMYYSVAFVTTIAYGDVTPKNPIQCLYTIGAFIIEAILWGYILTEILRLLINVYIYNFQRRYHHYALNYKLKNSMVSNLTLLQVQKHTEEIDKDQQYRNRVLEEEVLQILPADPLYGLLLAIYKDSLKTIGFSFAEKLICKALGPADYKSVFLESLMKQIKEERHFPGDVLYTSGEIEGSKPFNHCAYFFTNVQYKHSVVLGVGRHIGIVLDTNESEYVVVEKKGSFELYRPRKVFGSVEFLNGQERSHWAICLQNCLLFAVSRQALLDNHHLLTLEEKESIAMSSDIMQNKRCLICKEEHFFLHCPFSFPISKFILEPTYNVTKFETLRTHHRRKIRTTNAWHYFPHIFNIKMQITNEYKHRLYMSTTNYDLFVQLQLEQDLEKQEQELQHEIHQTQVIIQNLHKQELQELGLNEQGRSYEQVYNFSFFKPMSNINQIARRIKKLKRCELIKAVA